MKFFKLFCAFSVMLMLCLVANGCKKEDPNEPSKEPNDAINSETGKYIYGSDIDVDEADITNMLGTGKLYATSFGQADRDYLTEIMDEAVDGSSVTYEFDNQLKASDVEAGSVVVAVVGYTSKGISADITQTGEIARASDFAAKKDITLIIVQLDGRARRGESSDPIISAAVTGAKVVMIYDNNDSKGADYDKKYSEEWCVGKHLYKFSDEFEIYQYIAVLVGAAK